MRGVRGRDKIKKITQRRRIRKGICLFKFSSLERRQAEKKTENRVQAR